MPGIAGPSMGWFAVVWGVMCLLSSAVVTDALLRDTSTVPDQEAERAPDDAAPSNR